MEKAKTKNDKREFEYVNKDCWLSKKLGRPPMSRCFSCNTKLYNCPVFHHLTISLFLIIFALTFYFLMEGRISNAIIVSVIILTLVYGYFFNKNTEELIKSSLRQRKLKESLEDAKNVLEVKVAARTRELEEIAERQEESIKERTREIEDKMKDLEKFYNLAVGRELKMMELKKELKSLKEPKKTKKDKLKK